MSARSNLPWKTAWVTGASSGIGRDVVLQLAAAGVKVAASARSVDSLSKLAAAHSGIMAFPLDVTDAQSVKDAAKAIEAALGPIDLAIFNAGVWHPMGAADFSADKSLDSMAVNYFGVTNGVAAVIGDMMTRRSGHLAFVASVAGYRGLPKAAGYSPSKAAVISLAETLRPELEPLGVKVSIINPGFVETPMTSVNRFPMPFMIKSADAASRIISGLKAGKFEIAFPWQLVTLLKIARVLPYPLFFWYARNFLTPRKRS